MDDGRMAGRMDDGRMDDGRMDGRINEQMDGNKSFSRKNQV